MEIWFFYLQNEICQTATNKMKIYYFTLCQKKYLLKADPTLTGTTKATGTIGIAGTCLTFLTKARPCSEV